MFKLDLSDSYTWPVTVEVVDAGKSAKHTFDAQFRRLKQSQIDELIAAVRDGHKSDADLVAEVLVGWAGVKDAAGEDIPFTESSRDRVMDVYPVRPAVLAAWFESLAGAKRKN